MQASSYVWTLRELARHTKSKTAINKFCSNFLCLGKGYRGHSHRSTIANENLKRVQVLKDRNMCNQIGVRYCNGSGILIMRKLANLTAPGGGNVIGNIHDANSLVFYHPECTENTRKEIKKSFTTIENFISEEEEDILMKEIEPHIKRLRYEFDHWDDAIHGYREVERSKWGKASSAIITRLRDAAFPEPSSVMPLVHVLDLAEGGVIKPHIDSVRFCGNIISGLCLLSDAVMRLVHDKEKNQIVDVLLRRKTLYIMRDESRYNYTHEVLGEKDSYLGNLKVKKGRRVSLIRRNRPID
ncbi:alpha-ketoglutarate-dependent dioxygenase alkB homolog 7, mitochondrial [Oratosquilla oratoria]|uniref:alpha-ketoglutarate-dependent dioxygenase alkB homolog 7, mitochondrial n=1 Tax=Oratosquilla oratoria TaxID=337810 RepID=UPI003F76A5C0